MNHDSQLNTITARHGERGVTDAVARLHQRVQSRSVADLRNLDAPPDGPAPQRHVLMVSCAFPPTGGPGVQRSAKFAKYLPACGWRPVVCAAEQMPDLPHDDSLLRDLPGDLTVHRTPVYDPRPRLRARQARGGRISAKLAWCAERAAERILANAIPDHMLGWALRSYRTCRRLIDDGQIDAVYSTYSPASNHLLGYLLRRNTGLPWVADFRDLWTDDYCYPHRGRLRERADRALERRFLESADAVIGVTDGQRDVLRHRVPHAADKFFTITNGVDLADFATVDRTTARRRMHGPDDHFVLTFTGWFLSDRVSAGLIEGIARFGQWSQNQPGRFVLRIVGAVSEHMTRRIREAGVTVDAVGYLAHTEAIEHMAAADALLLLVPEGENAATLITGKIFEYLASGRPILLVAPAGECEAGRLLSACHTGTRANHDAESVCAALHTMWTRWQCGDPLTGCDRHHLAPYTRERLALRLGDVLTSICTQRIVR